MFLGFLLLLYNPAQKMCFTNKNEINKCGITATVLCDILNFSLCLSNFDQSIIIVNEDDEFQISSIPKDSIEVYSTFSNNYPKLSLNVSHKCQLISVNFMNINFFARETMSTLIIYNSIFNPNGYFNLQTFMIDLVSWSNKIKIDTLKYLNLKLIQNDSIVTKNSEFFNFSKVFNITLDVHLDLTIYTNTTNYRQLIISTQNGQSFYFPLCERKISMRDHYFSNPILPQKIIINLFQSSLNFTENFNYFDFFRTELIINTENMTNLIESFSSIPANTNFCSSNVTLKIHNNITIDLINITNSTLFIDSPTNELYVNFATLIYSGIVSIQKVSDATPIIQSREISNNYSSLQDQNKLSSKVPLSVSYMITLNYSHIICPIFIFTQSLLIRTSYYIDLLGSMNVTEKIDVRFNIRDSDPLVRIVLFSDLDNYSSIENISFDLNKFYPVFTFSTPIQYLFYFSMSSIPDFLRCLTRDQKFLNNVSYFGFKYADYPNSTFKYFCYSSKEEISSCPGKNYSDYYRDPIYIEDMNIIPYLNDLNYLENISIYMLKSMPENEILTFPNYSLIHGSKNPKLYVDGDSPGNYRLNLFIHNNQIQEYSFKNVDLYLTFPEENFYDGKYHLICDIFKLREGVTIQAPDYYLFNFSSVTRGIRLDREWMDQVPIRLSIEGERNTTINFKDKLRSIEFKNQSYTFGYCDHQNNTFAYSPPRPTMNWISYSPVLNFLRNETYGNLQKMGLIWYGDNLTAKFLDILYPIENNFISTSDSPLILKVTETLTISSFVELVTAEIQSPKLLYIENASYLPNNRVYLYSDVTVRSTTVISSRSPIQLVMSRILLIGKSSCLFKPENPNSTLISFYIFTDEGIDNTSCTYNLKGTPIFRNITYLSNFKILGSVHVKPQKILLLDNCTFFPGSSVNIAYKVGKRAPHIVFEKMENFPQILNITILEQLLKTPPVSQNEIIVSGLNKSCGEITNITVWPKNLVGSPYKNDSDLVIYNIHYGWFCSNGSIYLNSTVIDITYLTSSNVFNIVLTAIFGGLTLITSFVVLFLVIDHNIKNPAKFDSLLSDSERFFRAIADDVFV